MVRKRVSVSAEAERVECLQLPPNAAASSPSPSSKLDYGSL